MDKVSTILILLLIVFNGEAQSISQTLVSPTGGFASNGNVQLHWSLGELAIQSHDQEIKLTEGFYQPNLIIILNTDLKSNYDLNLDLYPNPTSDYLIIEHQEELLYNLYSIQGQELMSGVLKLNKDEITVNTIPDGSYILKFTLKSGQSITKKFIKTSN